MISPGFLACSALFFVAAWLRHGLAGQEHGVQVMWGAGLAYAALAGLPLTVGFGALSRLYAAWLPGGWVLLLVVVALLSLWLAVVYQTGRLWLFLMPLGLLVGVAWFAFSVTMTNTWPTSAAANKRKRNTE